MAKENSKPKVKEVEKTEDVKSPKEEKETGKKEEKETKKESKKEVEKKVEKKEKAIVNIGSLRISTKSSVAICKMISRKSLDRAIEMLEGVIKGKMPVRMSWQETAHQKSRGMKNVSGAKFPKKTAIAIIDVIKQLKANSNVNGIEEPIIFIAMANKAVRPFKSGGRKAKRTHLYIEARSKTKLNKKKK